MELPALTKYGEALNNAYKTPHEDLSYADTWRALRLYVSEGN